MYNKLWALCGILKHMDVLQQYEKQFPKEDKLAPQWQPSSEHGFLIRLVMKLSGGRIRDEVRANYVLVIAVAAMLVISFFTLFGIPGRSVSPRAFVPRGYEGSALPH